MAATATATVTLKDMIAYLGYTTAEFMKGWKKLTEQDKADLRQGFMDGSLTY